MPSKPMPENVLYTCLPGEPVKGIITGCKNRVIKRKHRDVIIEISINPKNTYKLKSSGSDFYSERDQKLIEHKKNTGLSFKDGERVYIWISRDFIGKLTIEHNGKIIEKWEPNKIDPEKYDKNPKTRPEPLMILIHNREPSPRMECTPSDPYGQKSMGDYTKELMHPYLKDEKLNKSKYSYIFENSEKPPVQDHYITGSISPNDINVEALNKLKKHGYISGSASQIMREPSSGSPMGIIVSNILSGVDSTMKSDIINSNLFKEAAGYTQSNWRKFNTLGMKMYVEKLPIGQYRFVLKGRLITPKGISAKPKTISMPVGSSSAEFLGANYARSGRNGLGGFKRLFISTAGNFKAGMSVQGIGTIIDFYGDFEETFGEGKSKEVNEFLARALVSLAKAGATAALGGILIAAIVPIFAIFTASSAIAVALGVSIAIAGYYFAATIVDFIDSSLSIKERAASIAR